MKAGILKNMEQTVSSGASKILLAACPKNEDDIYQNWKVVWNKLRAGPLFLLEGASTVNKRDANTSNMARSDKHALVTVQARLWCNEKQ